MTATPALNRVQRTSISQWVSNDSICVILIVISWAVAIVIVDPSGEFPSVDDWAYLASVRALIEKGEIVFSDWSAQNLISHLLWGALFSLPFGVSYLTLRISSLVAALLCALALYRLTREADQPPALALIAAWLLLFNPMFFPLSFTYMTDVPFLAAQTGAMLYLMRGLRKDSPASSAVGWTLAIAAQFSRQAGLVIPFAYGGAYLARYRVRPRNALLASLPLVVFLIAQRLYEFWLESSGRMSIQFGKQLQSILPLLLAPGELARNVIELAVYAFFYLGLFLLPLSIPVASAMFSSFSRKAAVVLFASMSVAAVILTVASFSSNLVMPIWMNANTWRVTGIGPDVSGIRAPYWFFQIVTGLSVAGGVLLVTCIAYAVYRHIIATKSSGLAAHLLIFGLLGAVASCGILSFVEIKFDRYIIAVIPWLALALVAGFPQSRFAVQPWFLALSGMLIAGMVWYAVVNTHNYMVEKRVWTGVVADMVAEGIPREKIDAGWVFNGDRFYGVFGNRKVRGSWVKRRDYLIRELGCYRVVGFEIARRYPVPRWPIFGDRGPDLFVCASIADAGRAPPQLAPPSSSP